MHVVDIREVKASLSKLVRAIESGQEREIVISRDGLPVAKLVPLDSTPRNQRIGIAKGKFDVPDSIDAHNKELARQFMGRDTDEPGGGK